MVVHVTRTPAEQKGATSGEIPQEIDSIAEAAKSNVDTISEVAEATEKPGNLDAGLKDLAADLRAAVDCHLPEKKGFGKDQKIPVLERENNLIRTPHHNRTERLTGLISQVMT